MPCWRVVYTKSNPEYRVTSSLAQEDLEVFLPAILSWKPRRGHRSEPLFPSYVFVRADRSSIPHNSCRLVAFDGQPAVVPDHAIAWIRRRLQAGMGVRLPFRPEERVRIVEGPLQGSEAIFEGPMGPAAQVRVLLEFF